MSFNYSSLSATSERLIERFGRDAVLTRVTEGSFDPATNTITSDSNVDETVKAVFTRFDKRQIDGDTTLRTDERVLVKTNTAPQLNDEIDGKKILNVETIKPADSALLFILQVRK